MAIGSSTAVAALVVADTGAAARHADVRNIARVRVAQATSNNPLKAFLSIFEKKEKRKPAPVIVRPRTTLPRGAVIQKRGNGRRIFNPFIGNGSGSAFPDQTPKPKTFSTGRRTMCVRLCDGYYWPMRRGGSNHTLMTDSQQCESQCTSPARLFVLHTSTDNIADMRDLGGRSYRKLKNAFAYRKTYNPSCGCRPKPWSERARLRHKSYTAVGKERRELAIRAIRLDLRSTLTANADPKLVLVSDASKVGGSHSMALPVRRPSLRVRSANLVKPNAGSVVSLGVLEETSSVPRSLGVEQGLQQSLWAGADAFGGGGNPPNDPMPRVLGFGDLRRANQSRVSRTPMSRAPRKTLGLVPVRSAFEPVALQLRSSLN